MKSWSTLLLLLLPAGFFTAPAEPQGVHWPSFRGQGAKGTADGIPAPAHWNVANGENIRWKVRVPGLGHSSPVIWGDRLFVTTAVSEQQKEELRVGLYGDITPVADTSVQTWKTLCFNKKTGELLWEHTATRGVPKIPRHPKSTHANPTPATDGSSLVVFFGSEGLYCLDLDGNLKWKKDLGLLKSGFFSVPSALWGFASSPVIHAGRVVVQCDVLNESFLAAFNLADGKEIWRTPRTDVPTWSTPTIHSENGQTQIILNGFRHMGGYDFFTGKPLWQLEGGGDIPVPTPVVDSGLIFLTNAHGSMAPVYAIRTDARGDLGRKETGVGKAVHWSNLGRVGAYMQTPLVLDGLLYVCRDNGVLTCFRSANGDTVYQQRLGRGGGFSASAVASGGKLYYTSEDGDVFVLRAGPAFEQLAVNEMGETCMATPAISEGVLYFRTRHHLVAVGE